MAAASRRAPCTMTCWVGRTPVGCARSRARSWPRSSTMPGWPRRSPARGPAPTCSTAEKPRQARQVAAVYVGPARKTPGHGHHWVSPRGWTPTRAPGACRAPRLLAQLFAADAVYLTSPYAEPVVGLVAIAEMVEDERHGPDEASRRAARWSPSSGETSQLVGREEVTFELRRASITADLWAAAVRRRRSGRHFEEWPFWPEDGVIRSVSDQVVSDVVAVDAARGGRSCGQAR